MLYIGITTRTVKKRWSQHKACANGGLGYPLYRAIKEYGPDAFTVETVYEGKDLADIQQMEVELIAKHNAYVRHGGGYNLTYGGESAGKMPREAVERARAARIGQIRTAKQKLAISAGRTGKVLLNDAARKHPKEMVLKAMDLIKQGIKQQEIVAATGLTQSYISNLKTKKRGHALLGA
jgi:hypothetical protein